MLFNSLILLSIPFYINRMGCCTALNKMACIKQQQGHAILQIQLQLQLQLVQVQMSLNNGIKAWKQDFKIVVWGGGRALCQLTCAMHVEDNC